MYIADHLAYQKQNDLNLYKIKNLDMVVAPLILGRDLKISDQNNWGGPEQKIKFWGGGAKIKGGHKMLGFGLYT